MHPWQAYLNKYQHTKLKPKIDNAWKEYLEGVPEDKKPEKTLFEIRNKLVQKLYEEESDKVKQEVEAHRNIMKDTKSTSHIE